MNKKFFTLIALCLLFAGTPLSAPRAFPYAPQNVETGGSLSRHIAVSAVSEKIGAGAQKYIAGMGERALSFLGNSSLSQDQKTQEVVAKTTNAFYPVH